MTTHTATTPEQFMKDLANEVIWSRINRFQVIGADSKGRVLVTDPGPQTEAEIVWDRLGAKLLADRRSATASRGL